MRKLSHLMQLTQQPLAQMPELDRLGHELHVNISENERVASATLGLGLVIAGMKFGSPLR